MSVSSPAGEPSPSAAHRRRQRRLRRRARRFGQRAEKLAARLLERQGMNVLARNFLGRHGEIDLVARDGGTLCFVEVKARRHLAAGSRPGDALTPAKKQRLVLTARHYLTQLGTIDFPHRYDLVEIRFHHGKLVEARHWPAEFTSADIRAIPPDLYLDRTDEPF